MNISEEVKKLITENLRVDVEIKEESSYRLGHKIKVIVSLEYDGVTISQISDYVEFGDER